MDIPQAMRELPTPEDIRRLNPKADANFEITDDGSGEFVLWLIDRRGTISGHYGEPVERHIKTYIGIPAPEVASDDAWTWLNNNAWWL